jgi:MFS family permease
MGAFMSELTVRRIVVWTISIVTSIIISWAILTFLLDWFNPNPNAGPVPIDIYGWQYFFWTAFPIALIIMTILDHFADSKIWPD